MPETGEKIINERNNAYGGAWKLHGLVVQALAPQVIDFMTHRPRYFFAWNLILNKLIRALTSPLDEDHWIDIQGYAELILQDIRSKKDGK